MSNIYLVSINSDKSIVKHTKFNSIKEVLESPYQTMFDSGEMSELVDDKRTECAARVFRYMNDYNNTTLNSTLILFKEDDDLSDDQLENIGLSKMREFDFINTLIEKEEKMNKARYVVGNTILTIIIAAASYGLYAVFSR